MKLDVYVILRVLVKAQRDAAGSLIRVLDVVRHLEMDLETRRGLELDILQLGESIAVLGECQEMVDQAGRAQVPGD